MPDACVSVWDVDVHSLYTSFLIPQLGREVLDLALKAVKPGVTTDELDRIVHEVCTCACVMVWGEMEEVGWPAADTRT